MESDFGHSVAGGLAPSTGINNFIMGLNWLGAGTWGWVIVAIMAILIILVIAMMFGWIGTAAVKKEGIVGNVSPLMNQVRDGVGESLTNSALASGYDADPNVFCQSAGEPTNDPWDYLRSEVGKAENATNYNDAKDDILTRAMKY